MRAKLKFREGWIMLLRPFNFGNLSKPLQKLTILYAYSEKPLLEFRTIKKLHNSIFLEPLIKIRKMDTHDKSWDKIESQLFWLKEEIACKECCVANTTMKGLITIAVTLEDSGPYDVLTVLENATNPQKAYTLVEAHFNAKIKEFTLTLREKGKK